MRKILFLFALVAFMVSCRSAQTLEKSNDTPVYILEDKGKAYSSLEGCETYSITVSTIGKPSKLDHARIGKYTWRKLRKGDKLDSEFRFVSRK